jgi:SecD/SecF fusion protein
MAVMPKTIDASLSAAGYPLRKVTMTPVAADDIKPAAVAAADAEPAGAGGHDVPLAFSSAIKTSTAARYFTEALEGLKTPEGGTKYDDPASLFEIEGKTAPDAAAGVYTAMVLHARPELAREDLSQALGAMEEHMAGSPIFEELNRFESAVAKEMQMSAALATFFSMIAIMAYIWFRFKNLTFGVAVVAALVHDVLVVLGSVALGAYLSRTPLGPWLGLEDFKINMTMIAAFLTIIGYSLNDTIVVFDRLREIRGKNPAITGDMVNLALNQTLARTLLTSLTVLIVVVILYAVGGEGIHGFAYCLVVGVLSGTYSTIYIAAPVLVWMMNRGAAAPARPATSVPQKSAAVRA